MAGNLTDNDGYLILQSNGWKSTITLFYGILFLTGTIGNILVIYVFGRSKSQKRKSYQLLLLALGICDLTTTIVISPLMIVMTLSAGKDLWFKLGCQAVPLLLSIGVSVTQVLLIIICYDRYRAIVTPTKSKLSWRHVRAGIVIGLVIALALDLPMLLQTDNKELHRGICFDYSGKGSIVVWQLAIYNFRDIFALAIMSYYIRKMILALKSSIVFRRNLTAVHSTRDTEEFKRTRKLLYAVLAVFVIFVFPTDIGFLSIFIFYNGAEYTEETTEIIAVVISVVILFQTANSSANVFIYSAIHPDFKKLLRRLMNFVSCTPQKPGNQENAAKGTVELSTM